MADALAIEFSIQRYDVGAYAAIVFIAVDSGDVTLVVFEGIGSNTLILPAVSVGQHHLVVGTLDVFPGGIVKQAGANDFCFDAVN